MGGRLIISRRVGERITIGSEIDILISDIYDDKVDVAIRAPKALTIKRRELPPEAQLGIRARNKSRQGR